MKIPAILLEGDEPLPAPKRPAKATAEKLKAEPLRQALPELPATYGTGRMLLAVRDPRCLYAHWDLSEEQVRHYNSLSRDSHLVVRLYYEWIGNAIAAEAHVHPDSRHWFVHVDRPGCRYIGQLGYYDRWNAWVAIVDSPAVTTPPAAMAESRAAEFITVPLDQPLRTTLPQSKPPAAPMTPPVQSATPAPSAAGEAYRQRGAAAPAAAGAAPREFGSGLGHFAEEHPAELPWTAAQETALSELITESLRKNELIGSLELVELLEKQWRVPREQAISSVSITGAAPQPEAVFSAAPEQQPMASPGGRPPARQRRFWFNINAELIIYGATEPGAEVRIGSRVIRLRPDGTFSYRFALPDGGFELPVSATSEDRIETRRADLRFGRETRYRGEVAAHPQDPALRSPSPENIDT